MNLPVWELFGGSRALWLHRWQSQRDIELASRRMSEKDRLADG